MNMHLNSNIKLSKVMLSYTPDIILDFFSKIEHQPWATLLYSNAAKHPNNRFDIMVAEPYITLTTHKDITKITQNKKSYFSKEDPLSLLDAILQKQFPTLPVQEDLPFCGGAIGFYGYNLAHRFEQIPSLSKSDLITPDMAIGIYDWALIADNLKEKLTIISWKNIQQRLTWLTKNTQNIKVPFKLKTSWVANLSNKQYAEKFKQIKEHITLGDCYQINFSQRFTAHYEGNEWQAFLSLVTHNKAPYSAFIRLKKSCILSFSPEQFLHLRQRQITTRPIKGTLPRSVNPIIDNQQAQRLANSGKNIAENLMIVDLMRNDLGKVAKIGSVNVPNLLTIEAFPAVFHLVSTITAILAQPFNATHLLRACFPGGSITGAPKIKAMVLIESLELQKRNIYCGNIGYISCCGTMDTNITIRTLLAENKKIHCWAGSGIVADSSLLEEYQETFFKVDKILSILSSM